MAKISDSKSVAYFDRHEAVETPGFYIVEKESADNDGEILLGRQVFPSPDGEGWSYEETENEEGGEE